MGSRLTVGVVSAAALTCLVLPMTSTAAAPAPAGTQTATVAGHTYRVQPHGRSGVKPVRPSAVKQSRNTLTVRSSNTQGVDCRHFPGARPW